MIDDKDEGELIVSEIKGQTGKLSFQNLFTNLNSFFPRNSHLAY